MVMWLRKFFLTYDWKMTASVRPARVFWEAAMVG